MGGSCPLVNAGRHCNCALSVGVRVCLSVYLFVVSTNHVTPGLSYHHRQSAVLQKYVIISSRAPVHNSLTAFEHENLISKVGELHSFARITHVTNKFLGVNYFPPIMNTHFQFFADSEYRIDLSAFTVYINVAYRLRHK